MRGNSLDKMSGGSNTIEKTGRNKRESHIPTRGKVGDMALSQYDKNRHSEDVDVRLCNDGRKTIHKL